jgi:hypothetical protein
MKFCYKTWPQVVKSDIRWWCIEVTISIYMVQCFKSAWGSWESDHSFGYMSALLTDEKIKTVSACCIQIKRLAVREMVEISEYPQYCVWWFLLNIWACTMSPQNSVLDFSWMNRKITGWTSVQTFCNMLKCMRTLWNKLLWVLGLWVWCWNEAAFSTVKVRIICKTEIGMTE